MELQLLAAPPPPANTPAERDEGLDIAVLQHLDIRVDGAYEARHHRQEVPELPRRGLCNSHDAQVVRDEDE